MNKLIVIEGLDGSGKSTQIEQIKKLVYNDAINSGFVEEAADYLVNLYVSSNGLSKTAELLGIGALTLEDIVAELQKPGRDPRDELPAPMLKQDIMGIEDLTVGMEMSGTVRNVIDSGKANVVAFKVFENDEDVTANYDITINSYGALTILKRNIYNETQ